MGGELSVGGAGTSLAPALELKLAGGSVSLQPNQAMVGYVPDVGPGWRSGIQWDAPGSQFFITTRAYWQEVGGDTGFSKRHAQGLQLTGQVYQPGYWDQTSGRWVSGVSLLRILLSPAVCHLPYQEVPAQ